MSDRVDQWLPELADRRVLRRLDAALDDTVPAKRPITLDDLLTLRIGLGAVMAPPGRYPVQFAMAELGVSPGPDPISCGPDEFMARIGRLPLMHQPGEGWMYHTGADILAVLIARVAGMTLAEFLHARIFAPLGMRDTGFDVPPAAHHRLVASYTMTEAGGLQQCEPAGGGSYAQPPAFPSELVSTADDYLAFCRMLLAGGQGPQGRLLSSEHVRMMVTDHITPAQKAASPFFPGFWDRYGWGFGGAVTAAGGGPGHPGSYGWMGGFGTSMLVDPAARMTTIVMIQCLMRCPADAALAAAIQAAAYATRCP